MNMNPVEAAIVSACQSGMGGTGDVAILSTANRMNLMPFAQVATRLGGAITVITMTAIFRMLLTISELFRRKMICQQKM